MNSVEIIEYLREEATEKYKSNIVKMGIPERYCIGVSTATLRNLAKQLDKSNQLAFELWHTITTRQDCLRYFYSSVRALNFVRLIILWKM